jgi:hypothetical protein
MMEMKRNYFKGERREMDKDMKVINDGGKETKKDAVRTK